MFPIISFNQTLLRQLRTIFDLIVQFQRAQDDVYTTALAELKRREEWYQAVHQRAEEVGSDASICMYQWESDLCLYLYSTLGSMELLQCGFWVAILVLRCDSRWFMY